MRRPPLPSSHAVLAELLSKVTLDEAGAEPCAHKAVALRLVALYQHVEADVAGHPRLGTMAGFVQEMHGMLRQTVGCVADAKHKHAWAIFVKQEHKHEPIIRLIRQRLLLRATHGK